MASKLCDSCKTTTATLFCRADSAFLCVGCDSKVHAANKLASRHARVWVCEVCEQAPAQVMCKADAAVLCAACDRDIHSVNPLARRHERVPVTPFYDTAVKSGATGNSFEGRCFSDVDKEADLSRDEAEAASWLLPNPNSKAIESPDLNSGRFVFPEMDTYLNLDYGSVDLKTEAEEQSSPGADRVVPVERSCLHPSMENGSYFDIDFTEAESFSYGYNTHSANQSLSSSSMEVAVVPDGSVMNDISNPYAKPAAERTTYQAVQISAADREARVLRYREKRKNRKFEKTIRYASRKAYAETRPRVKGRFAKRTDEVWEYSVVPTF